MILEIHLSNIFSLRDEIVVDMQAATIQTAAARTLADNTFACGDETLLKSVGIIGANASGKSNVIKAIRAFINIIKESHNYNENTNFGITPFKFEGYSEKPSSFYIRFLLEETEYEYSFSVLKDEVLTESLYYYPNGRRSLVFQRDETNGGEKKDAYTFQKAISRPLDIVANTSRKTLFLSRASQMDREIAKKIFRFFTDQIVTDFNKYATINLDAISKIEKERLLTILQEADSDIVDVRVQNGIGGDVQLEYRLGRNASVTAISGINYYGWMSPSPNTMTAYYGGYMTLNTNNGKWAVDVGMRQVYNSTTGRWDTVPIVMPYYNLGGAKLGFDFGGLLYGAFNKAKEARYSEPEYMNYRGPAIIALPST